MQEQVRAKGRSEHGTICDRSVPSERGVQTDRKRRNPNGSVRLNVSQKRSRNDNKQIQHDTGLRPDHSRHVPRECIAWLAIDTYSNSLRPTFVVDINNVDGLLHITQDQVHVSIVCLSNKQTAHILCQQSFDLPLFKLASPIYPPFEQGESRT